VTRRSWSQAHEIERISLLRADVDSVFGRLITETVRHAVDTTTEVRVEMERQMELFEGVHKLALESIDAWLTDCAGRRNADGG
jgi:hypothetical protein